MTENTEDKYFKAILMRMLEENGADGNGLLKVSNDALFGVFACNRRKCLESLSQAMDGTLSFTEINTRIEMSLRRTENE